MNYEVYYIIGCQQKAPRLVFARYKEEKFYEHGINAQNILFGFKNAILKMKTQIILSLFPNL